MPYVSRFSLHRINRAFKRDLFLLLLCLSFFFCSSASAAVVQWVSPSSGDWSVGSNWSSGAVPAPGDDVVIDVPGNITVTIPSGAISVQSILAQDNLYVNGGSLTLTGTSQIFGEFRLNGGALLRVQGALASFVASGAANIENGRFEVTGGAVVDIQNAPTVRSNGLGGSQTVISVRDAGSRLDLSSVTNAILGINQGFGAFPHRIEALNGGVVDFSGLLILQSTASGDDFVRLESSGGGQVLFSALHTTTGANLLVALQGMSTPFPALQTMSGGQFTALSGTTLNFPALTSATSSVFTVQTGSTVEAPLLTSLTLSSLTIAGSGQFNSAPLSDITNLRFALSGGAVFDRISATSYVMGYSAGPGTVVSVQGTGSRLDLSSVTTFTIGYEFSSVSYTQRVEATSDGIIDFSGLTTLSSGAANNDYVQINTSTGGQIQFNVVQTITGYNIIFSMQGMSTPFPALQTMSGGQFTALSGTTLNFPALTSATSSVFTVQTGSTVEAPLLSSFTYGTLTITETGQFNSAPLSDITNLRFALSGGAVFDKISATSYAMGYSAGAGTVISVQGTGSRLDLSSVTTFTIGYEFSSVSYTQRVEATSGGIIDFSGLTTLSSSASGNDYAEINTSTGGQILFDSLQTITGVNLRFNLDSASFPALQQLNSLTVTALTGATLSFASVTSAAGNALTVQNGAIFNAPNLTNLTSGSLTITGTGQFNSGMLSNINNARFTITGGAVFDRISATTYTTTGAGTSSPVISVRDAGSRLDMSSVTSLTAGVNGSGALSQIFEATNGAVLDLSGLTSLSSAVTQTDDWIEFRATTAGQILLSALKVLATKYVRFVAQSGGLIDLSALNEMGNTDIRCSADGTGSTIHLQSLCTYQNVTFSETNNGTIDHSGVAIAQYINSALFGVRAIGQSGACSGPACSVTSLFSLLPFGGCFRVEGTVLRTGEQLDIDGLAADSSYGLLGFELVHDTATGLITGSRLVSINHDTGAALSIGPLLALREIRGAAFLGDELYAIDSAYDELLQIAPSSGAIVGAPRPLTLAGSGFDLGSASDLTFSKFAEALVSHGNSLYALDLQSGVLSLEFTDSALLGDGLLPAYSGASYATDNVSAEFKLAALSASGFDQLLQFDAAYLRSVLMPVLPEPPGFNALLGDLAAVTTLDTTAPGPVTFTMNPNGNGTTVQLDWSPYDEAANGGDIHHYTIYRSPADFSDASSATVAGTVNGGNKMYQVSGLTRGQTVYLAVVAVDTVGNQNLAVDALATVPVDIVAPGEVANLSVTSLETSLALSWQPPSDGDLDKFRVYKDGVLVDGNIPAGSPNYNLQGLSAATLYTVRVSAVDQSNNESAGVSKNGATWLNNPGNVQSTGLDGKVALSWNAVTPANLLKQYRVYVESAPFNEVSALTPKAIVSAGTTHTEVAGLVNGQIYYAAVTAVNISDGERPQVTAVQAAPAPDLSGPALSAAQIGGVPLSNGLTIDKNSSISVVAQDTAGVSLVEFMVNGGSVDITLSADTQSPYSANWDITQFPDGPYTFKIRARDALGNESLLSYTLTVAMAPPAAPLITSPANGSATNQSQLLVAGTSALNTTVTLYNNNQPVVSAIPVGANGQFAATLTLVSGSNMLSADATGRGGTGPRGPPVTVTLDTQVPNAPASLSATSRTAGEIRLSWSAVQDERPITYRVYRSANPFTEISQAQLVNSQATAQTSYIDRPDTDGYYYYRVVALSPALNASAPSMQAGAASDRTAPSAVQIGYNSSGMYDPQTGRMAPGLVTVTAQVSEALLAAPFVSVAPQGGLPISLELAKTDDLHYTGAFEIKGSTPSGTAYIVFSGRDLVGNRGTDILSGQSILIDTDAPSITGLAVTPAQPIKNSQANPVQIDFSFTLSEAPAPATTPALTYLLSGVGRTPIAINTVNSTDPQRLNWQGSFVLPSDAGLSEVETFEFILQSADDLGNDDSTVQAPNSFQVYQGDLPPLVVPAGLTATARPAGRVELHWNAVAGASGYQLYRRGPNALPSDPLNPLGAQIGTLTLDDNPGVDGQYEYAVASVRQFNNQESLSAQSAPAGVVADSVAPNAPQNLVLQLTAQGVVAVWQEPAGGAPANGALTYSLYRDNLPPGVGLLPAGLTAIRSGIEELQTIDAQPSENDHAYAVIALDHAGNESAPSNTEYLNFSLLPVNSIQVLRVDEQPPLVSWYHSGSTVTAYRLELLAGSDWLAVQEGAAVGYTDQGYTSGERQYRVTALDINAAQSLARSITLPSISANLPASAVISRGIFNRLTYSVQNTGSSSFADISLKVQLDGKTYTSASFDLAGGGSRDVEVIVGGESALASEESLQTTIEISPNQNENIQIIRTQTIPVNDAAFLINIEAGDLVRNATGQVRFSFENTSSVATEIKTARQGGTQSSDEVRFKLADPDGNVFAVLPIKQYLGSGVLTVASGDTVARVQPGQTFTSDWFSIDVPSGLPESARLELEIDKFHYGLGSPQHAEVGGHGTSKDVSLAQTPYFGEIISATPALSYGDEEIVIIGRAVERGTLEALDAQPLDLVLRLNGFEKIIPVYTGADGQFQYRFTPGNDERGVFTVSAIYPGALDRPAQATFTVGGVALTPSRYNIRIPKNFEKSIQVKITNLSNAALDNVRFEYVAEDQPGLVLAQGVSVGLPAPVNLAPGESRSLTLLFSGAANAPASGSLRLRVLSNSSGARVLAYESLWYEFSAAAPSISFVPGVLETGVAHDSTVSESVQVKNSGLAPLLNAQFELLTYPAAQPAPSWIYLASAANLARLEVGEQRRIDVLASPGASVVEGYHQFILRVTADGGVSSDLPIVVAVTQSGIGNVLAHISDIYTATLDENGQPIPGLAGARVKLENEDVFGIEYQAVSDSQGEVFFQDVPAGNYILRVSASDHNDNLVYLRVRPGITSTEEIFLLNSVVVVEWSVTEIALEDRYEIFLNAVYETDVPVAVLVFEPVGTQLPDLRRGDVYYGELSLTNYGLIEASNVVPILPGSDERARYEFLTSFPGTIDAKQRIIIPYRITALADFNPAQDGGASGGGSCHYVQSVCVEADSVCANGTAVHVGSCGYWHNSRNCTTPEPPPSGNASGGPGPNTHWVPSGSQPSWNIPCLPGLDCDQAVGDPNG